MKLRLIVTLVLILSACSFGEPKPETAVTEGFQKMLELERASFSLSLAANSLTDSPLSEGAVFSFALSGKSDSRDEENPKFDGKGILSITDQKMAMKIALDLRLLGKKLYLNLTDTDLPTEAEALEQSLAAFQGKWWVIENPAESSPYLKSLTEEQKQLAEELQGIQLFTEPVKVLEEEMNGLASRKYKIALSRSGLKQFLLIFAKLGGNEIPEAEAAALEESLKDVTFEGFTWISKRGGVMNRIAGKLITEDIPSLDIDVRMWDVGKKFSVEEPKDATAFDPAQLFSGLGFPTLPDDAEEDVPPEEPIDQPLGAEQVE